MAFLIWIILLTLLVFSFLFNNKVPLWLSIIGYLVVVIFRVKEKIGNYLDWKKISQRDEKLKLEEFAEEMATKGLTFSGIRNKGENRIKEDFTYERKRKNESMKIT